MSLEFEYGTWSWSEKETNNFSNGGLKFLPKSKIKCRLVQEKCQSASDKNRLQINSQTLVSYSLLKSTVFKLFVDNLYNHESPKMSHRSLTTKLDILLSMQEVDHLLIRLIHYFDIYIKWIYVNKELHDEYSGEFLPDGKLLLQRCRMKTRNITKMDKLLKDMKSDAGRAYSACLLALPQTSLKRLPPYVGTKFIEFIIFFVWVALKRENFEEIRDESIRLFRGKNHTSFRSTAYSKSTIASAGLTSSSRIKYSLQPDIGILATKIGHVNPETLEMLDEEEIKMKESLVEE